MSIKYRAKIKHGSKMLPTHQNAILKGMCLVLFLGVVITGVVLFLCIRQKSNDVVLQKMEKLVCYAANQDIMCGQQITKEMIKEVTIIPGMKKEYYADSNCIGQYAAVDISLDMVLAQNMIETQHIKDQEREVECQVITLNQNLTENDRVDVRLMLPNGEDYIVLSQKGVHGIQAENENNKLCYLWMTEDEILYYSAAIVDAYLYPGAVLYTTKYIKPRIQSPSIVTYVPSLATMSMMKENPNLLKEAISYMKGEERKELENRLTDYLNKDIRTVSWEEEENKKIDKVDDQIKPENIQSYQMPKEDSNKQDKNEEKISAFVEDEPNRNKEEP